jgi:hypothetical protein
VVYNFFVKDEGIGTVVGFFVYCFFSLFGLRYKYCIIILILLPIPNYIWHT